MAIVGFEYDPEGVDTVRFRPPDDRPHELRRIKLLLVIGALLSFVSAAQLVGLISDVYGASDRVKQRSEELNRDPETRKIALELAMREHARLMGEEAAGSAPATVEEAEELLQRALDGMEMFVTLAGQLLLVMLAVLIYFPIKYLLQLRGIGQGHPQTYRKIVVTARIQLGMELFRNWLLFLMNAGTKVVKLPNSPSLNLLVAVFLLIYLRRTPVREYFSEYRLQLEPAEPSAPPPAAAAEPPAVAPAP